MDVKVVWVLMVQIGEGLGVLGGIRDNEGLQGVHCHHPWGNAGSQVLPKEGPQWYILPLLDVTGCNERRRRIYWSSTFNFYRTMAWSMKFTGMTDNESVKGANLCTYHSSHSSEPCQRCDPLPCPCWLALPAGCHGRLGMPSPAQSQIICKDQTLVAELQQIQKRKNAVTCTKETEPVLQNNLYHT